MDPGTATLGAEKGARTRAKDAQAGLSHLGLEGCEVAERFVNRAAQGTGHLRVLRTVCHGGGRLQRLFWHGHKWLSRTHAWHMLLLRNLDFNCNCRSTQPHL